MRSVQISRENLFEGMGVGVFEYSDPKWHWNASFATPEAKRFLGEDPQTPLKTGCFVSCSLTNTCIYYRAPHYALSGFLVLSQADPCYITQQKAFYFQEIKNCAK